MPIKRDRFVGSQLVDAFVLSSRFTRWIVIFHPWLDKGAMDLSLQRRFPKRKQFVQLANVNSAITKAGRYFSSECACQSFVLGVPT